jgi:hypothetical protein
MAQPEVGSEGESRDERLLLNTFPKPAKAKQIKESMTSFFIVSRKYKLEKACRPDFTGLADFRRIRDGL